MYENLLLIVERTTGKVDSAHVLKKKPLFDKILADVPRFLKVARNAYPKFEAALSSNYDDTNMAVRILYIPFHEAAQETIATCPQIVFFQGSTKKYFFALCKTLSRSARIEFFSYLKLGWSDVGSGVLSAGSKTHEFTGHLLPEGMSSFPTGYKVVSFYADPESLMVGAYVLRRDGWRDHSHLYQRILVRNKIKKMRRYLVDQKRVFVNNVIVTLPHDTLLNDHISKGQNIPENELHKAKPVTVTIPIEYGKIGIVDGQHRVFCYHEDNDELEKKIAPLRKRQHLLVTGIIYPSTVKDTAKLEFEARLFLEINDTQTRARPALRQDIETIVRPFSGLAVARQVISELAKKGPYSGKFQVGYFDAPTKIKTSSIVSYGLRPLVKFDGNDSLYAAWPNADKSRLKEREGKSTKGSGYDDDLELLAEYVAYCVKSVNEFLLAAKLSFGTDSWDVEIETPSALLRPTSINGLIACLRRVISNKLPLDHESHLVGMKTIKNVKFFDFKSSRWDALGEALFEKYQKGAGS